MCNRSCRPSHGPAGLANRNLFQEALERAPQRASLQHNGLAVLFIDLDRFKLTNDTLGHAAGDALRKVMAARLTALLRGVHSLARLGGDEFMLLLDQVTDPLQLGGRSMQVSASVGISLDRPTARTPPPC